MDWVRLCGQTTQFGSGRLQLASKPPDANGRWCQSLDLSRLARPCFAKNPHRIEVNVGNWTDAQVLQHRGHLVVDVFSPIVRLEALDLEGKLVRARRCQI